MDNKQVAKIAVVATCALLGTYCAVTSAMEKKRQKKARLVVANFNAAVDTIDTYAMERMDGTLAAYAFMMRRYFAAGKTQDVLRIKELAKQHIYNKQFDEIVQNY